MITDNRVLLFHRVANTLNYLDIKTVVVSCGTCYDQLQGLQVRGDLPGSRIVDIHEYLLEKGITLGAGGAGGYLFHDPCHSPMKQQDPMKTVRALVGENVLKSERCCGESGTLGVTRRTSPPRCASARPRSCARDEAALRATGGVPEKARSRSSDLCPSCLQGLLRRTPATCRTGCSEADYVVIEMASRILGPDWLPGLCRARQRRGHRARAGLIPATVHCRQPAPLMSACQKPVSCWMKAASAGPSLGSTSRPKSSSLARTSGAVMALFISAR